MNWWFSSLKSALLICTTSHPLLPAQRQGSRNSPPLVYINKYYLSTTALLLAYKYPVMPPILRNYLFLNLIFIGVYLIYNVVLVSDVQLYMYTIPFQLLLHYRLLQDIDYSSLRYVVSPCCLSFALYVVVCICHSRILNLSLLPAPL